MLDTLFLRRPKLDYISPAICESIFSSSGSPIIILADIEKSNGPTGLVLSGSAHTRLTWDSVPGALCYNVYTAVETVTDILVCQQLAGRSRDVAYRVIAECVDIAAFTIPQIGCYRVSAITGNGETDLSDPICVCDLTPPTPVPPTAIVCNDEQTAECVFPAVGAPVTIPAGTFCVEVEDTPEARNPAKIAMNNQAMAQAQSELSCSISPPCFWNLTWNEPPDDQTPANGGSVSATPTSRGVTVNLFSPGGGPGDNISDYNNTGSQPYDGAEFAATLTITDQTVTTNGDTSPSYIVQLFIDGGYVGDITDFIRPTGPGVTAYPFTVPAGGSTVGIRVLTAAGQNNPSPGQTNPTQLSVKFDLCE